MKDTNLNSALFASQARGRKHLPLAVVAVVVIHVVLFLVLLVAAGCRAKARAKENARQEKEMAARSAAPTNLVVQTPAGAAAPPVLEEAPAIATTSEAAEGVTIYVVKPGDNLGAIARKHGTTVDAIKIENDLNSDFIKAGQQLRVPFEARLARR